jgi:serine/threonine protein kinase
VSIGRTPPKYINEVFDRGSKVEPIAHPTAPLWDVKLEPRGGYEKRTLTKDMFETKSSIQSGSSVNVLKVEMKETGRICALKQFHIKNPAPSIDLETSIMVSLMGCPAIVGYIGQASQMQVSPKLTTPAFIVMEYMPNGSISDYLDRPNWKVSPTQKAKWAIGIAIALNYCHQIRVIHGDISSNNILLDSRNEVHLCDFGSAYSGDRPQRMSSATPLYAAPDDGVLTRFGDVYSYAIVLWEIITGQRYKNSQLTALDGLNDVIKRVQSQSLRPVIDENMKQWVREWLQELWNPVARQRGTFAQIKEKLRLQNYNIVDGVDTSVVQEYVQRMETTMPKLPKSLIQRLFGIFSS